MPLISYNYGRKNVPRMKKVILFSTKIALLFMVVVSIGCYLGADVLISQFMKNQAIIAYGGAFLRGLCLSTPFMCMDFLAVGVFQACGMGRKAFLFAILRKIVLEIPALFVWNYFWPLYGLAYAQLTAEAVLSVAAVLVLYRLFRSLERV